MSSDPSRPSRRGFLNAGAQLIGGGVIGCAASAVLAGSTAPSRAPGSGPAELPWAWAKIDPMEAGSRAFRYYHDAGG
jgi:hypothetical protein